MSGRIAKYGMLIALSFLLGYVETLIPFSVGIPGVKLGLANVVTLVCLYQLGTGAAFWISLVRIVLVGFTFGNLSMLLYSLSGELLSLGVMCLCKRCEKLSPVGVSVAGGAAHNIGQLLVAMAVVWNRHLAYYAPFLLAAGTIAGVLIGVLGGLVIRRIPAEKERSTE